MIYKRTLRCILSAALLAGSAAATFPSVGAAQSVGEPMVIDDPMLNSIAEAVNSAPITMRDLANPDSSFYKDRGTFTVSGARAKMIESAARGVGIRGGYADEARHINDLLMGKFRRPLEAHYPFRRLMLQQGYVVPPVITQIANVKELNGPNYLYLTSGSFEIVREPRLTTEAPSWMDWLLLPIRDVRPPDNIELEGDEKSLWGTAVREGWKTGVREARLAFTTALATMHRDYQGMQLYQTLASQGVLRIPQIDIARVPWRVTADGKRAFDGEVIIEIKAGPEFRRRR
tara:strand:- start:22421 stop:23284 length:864 start_codon:yes stop_codon:yes gene_type:complete